MDPAVSLVEAYLFANGYMTATEYPVLQRVEGGGYRSLTDIDVLAIRLPGAGRVAVMEDSADGVASPVCDPDPRIVGPEPDHSVDFIIGEVKEGRAEFNPGARLQGTILTALRRFAFLEPGIADRVAGELLERGEAYLKKDHTRIRLVAFGSHADQTRTVRYTQITHRQCISYLLAVSRQNAAAMKAVQSKHPAVAMLSLLAKSGYPGFEPDRSDAPEVSTPGKKAPKRSPGAR